MKFAQQCAKGAWGFEILRQGESESCDEAHLEFRCRRRLSLNPLKPRDRAVAVEQGVHAKASSESESSTQQRDFHNPCAGSHSVEFFEAANPYSRVAHWVKA